MWEQVKNAKVETPKEVWGSVSVARNSPKSMRWNDEVKTALERKEALWKSVFEVREWMDCERKIMEIYRDKENREKWSTWAISKEDESE